MTRGPGGRLIPGGRLVSLAAAGLPVAALDGGTGLGLAVCAAFDGSLLAAAAWEARALARRAPSIERHVEPRLVVGADNRIVLRLHNRSDRFMRVVVRDDLPPGWQADPEELHVALPPWSRREASYVVRPPSRGRFRFGDLHLRIEGRARLGAALVRVEAAQDVRVYPNVLGPRRYELLTRLGDLHQAGFRSVRLQGGSGELDQLREYVPGDPYRDVDWKSTAKRRRPVTRAYQQERSQRVLLCVDAGRTMAARMGDIAKLDHAVDATLLLAYVALHNGDRVGLVVFGDAVRAYVPPAGGPAQYRRILEALYSVQAAETFVDFRRLVEFVQVRVPRRALVVVFSDLLDEAHAMPLAEHAALLRRRHLPVCVTMDDPVADELADAEVRSADDVYRRAAAADVLADREAVKAHLRKAGVQLVEAAAGQLAVAAVNRYLALKARHRL
ncbi:MAG: DUF58 domain-containing protein [Myxococcota bacterium]